MCKFGEIRQHIKSIRFRADGSYGQLLVVTFDDDTQSIVEVKFMKDVDNSVQGLVEEHIRNCGQLVDKSIKSK